MKPPSGWYWWEVVLAGLLLLLFVAACVGIGVAWNQWLYGDWHCAFIHCRKVVP